MAQNLDEIAAQFGGQAVSAPVANAIAPSASFSQNANLDVYNSLKDEYKPIVNSLAEGRSGFGRYGLDKNLMTKMYIVANQIDPALDNTTLKARQNTATDFAGSGVSGKKFSSIETAMIHMRNLEESYGRLNNGNTPGLNKFENNALKGNLMGLGDYIAPDKVKQIQGAYADANTHAGNLSGELAQAFRSGGGMAEADIQRELERLNIHDSPEGMKSTIGSIMLDLKGKYQPMIDNYNRTMGTKKTLNDFITNEESRAIFNRVSSGGFGDNKAAPATNKQINIPKDAVNFLKMNPKLAADFDVKYGAGASKNILGK